MEVSAASMLRDARRRARLSQTDLARRAGVAQSVISVYESDRREPGFRTLTRLIEATGHQLSLELIPPAQDRLGLPDTRLGRRLRRHRRAVIELAARAGAHNPRVFGSVARAEDTDASDIDLLVDLDDDVSLVTLSRLSRELTELLGVNVDVVPAGTLKPGVHTQVLAQAIQL